MQRTKQRNSNYVKKCEENMKNSVIKNVKLSPKNASQMEALKIIKNNQISFLIGAAGTGKTYLSVMCAIEWLLKGFYDKVILTRPVVEAGEKLGSLPGSYTEKISPYMDPIFNTIGKYMSKNLYNGLMTDGKIEVKPLAYMRGTTFDNSIIICDEFQNASNDQLLMVLTRIGENSKIIITADPDQTDLKSNQNILKISSGLSEIEGIGIHLFSEEDIVRNPLIKEILFVFKNLNID